jgi:hypothetical protein
MIKRLKVFIYLLIGLTGLNACSSSKNKPLIIAFSADSTAIQVRDIDAAGLHQMKMMGDPDSLTTPLLTVLDTPTDEDSTSQEQQVPGRLRLVNDTLEFKPEKPFQKGRAYLVTTYLNVRFGNLQSALKGTMRNGVKPNQTLLTR